MKHKLTPSEINFLQKLVGQDCIIKHDSITKEGVLLHEGMKSMVNRGYCSVHKVLNGPLRLWTGEYFILLTEAGRTIIEHILVSEVPIVIVIQTARLPELPELQKH